MRIISQPAFKVKRQGLWLVHFSSVFGPEEEALLEYLSGQRREKAASLQFGADKKASLMAGLLEKHVFGGAEFACEDNGKPYLPGNEGVHFSLSHCCGAAALALSDSPAGVDVENLSDIDTDTILRFCTENEKLWVGTDALRAAVVWTRKEAWMKRSGEGFSADFARFDTLDAEKADMLETYILGGHILSTCGMERQTVIEMDEKDLINETAGV